MKTYQFIVFAALLALIVGAMAWSKKKKPCGCGGHAATETTVETADPE